MRRADVAIVGAGIAGASLAAELAPYASVTLIEAEDQPGYHSTGRSAAFWSETFGGPLVQPLTTASRALLENPSADLASGPLIAPRGAVHLADGEGVAVLDALEREFAGTEVALERLDRAGIEALLPGLRPGWDEALFERSCMDIDVAALHASGLRRAKGEGAVLLAGERLAGAERRDGRWLLSLANEQVEADIVVVAAGAWASEVAALFGAYSVRMQPYRRTLAQLRIDPAAAADMPLVIDALGRFYFKPESGGRLWLSPHDETPSSPCDCAAEDYDVALAIDRMQAAVDWRVERVEHSWAGLRSFAPDRLPVYGFDSAVPGLFWCAGQGGFGIQTAPAAAKLAAALLLNRAPDEAVAHIDPAPYSPRRFAN